MMTSRTRFLGLGGLVACGIGLSSCGVGLNVVRSGEAPVLVPHAPFAVVEEAGRLDTNGMVRIGTVRTRDKGLTMRCDYASVLDTVSGQARALGANIVRMDEHLPPSVYGSSCHRIKATLFRAADARPYETRIEWDRERPLTVSDFKGDTAARPFEAVTMSWLGYVCEPRWGKANITVKVFFDCQGSYFKPKDPDGEVLRHEQLHFDIAEVHARLLRQRIASGTFKPATVREQVQALYEEEWRAVIMEQDHYDADVKADPAGQPRWAALVAERLAALEPHRSPSFTIQLH